MTSKELEESIRTYQKETKRLLIEQRSGRTSFTATPGLPGTNAETSSR
jgi:hypothetical protein